MHNYLFFFFNDTATTEIYTLSLHDALPISRVSLAQALYDQAADLQKEGVGTGIDTLRANVELQNEKQRLIEAETDRQTSLFALIRLLNLDPRQAIELGDSLSFFDTPHPEA